MFFNVGIVRHFAETLFYFVIHTEKLRYTPYEM